MTPAPCHCFYARSCHIACPKYLFCAFELVGQDLLVVWGTMSIHVQFNYCVILFADSCRGRVRLLVVLCYLWQSMFLFGFVSIGFLAPLTGWAGIRVGRRANERPHAIGIATSNAVWHVMHQGGSVAVAIVPWTLLMYMPVKMFLTIACSGMYLAVSRGIWLHWRLAVWFQILSLLSSVCFKYFYTC